MRLFIKKISILLLVVSAFVFVGECIVRYDINPYQYKHDYIMKKGSNIKTLILGSSHTYFGVMPSVISDSTFNLANVSQPLLYDYYMLKNYRSYLPNLKQVVLDVGYLSLRSNNFNTPDSRQYKMNYRIYMNFFQISYFSSLNLMSTEPALFRSRVKSVVAQKTHLTCDKFGWGEDYNILKKEKDWADASAAIKRHTGGENYAENVHKNIYNLSCIAEFCKANNIELTIISMPIWYTYRDSLDVEQLDDVYSAIEGLKKDYEFDFVDYSMDTRFDADDFFDSDHLSNVGAEKFSRILADTLGVVNL